ncbi:flippase-like domain-containing protein [Phycicoccus endophyticus]|uniref:Flippase-like domain-containing protein n=1 Tax=Phycicoccus endophyticus TaxID=1690220 RepID=A0A7G9R323_9MICO|nr:lysylphosphatidylglycerol synthase domain-containing protein [Phycicoccus endophyticus]NHI20293.1 hypothetical protein [Phycicoccus endophyticus]QNN49998.1 flippase-like domain-containing protein [Phycicoccus endophyticus]GGL28974.1 hypothetical protein GCM10012283_09040 [Phycicoccus endophyticus]
MSAPEVRPARRWLTGRAVRIAFYVATAAALVWVVLSIDWSELGTVRLSLPWAAGAIATGMLFRYLGALVWRSVLKGLGADHMPPVRVLAEIYAKTWLARYIPGTAPWIAGKVLLAAEQGISRSRLAVSSVVEAAAKIVASGVVSLVLLALDPRIGEISTALRWLVVLGALVLLLVMTPPVFNRLLAVMFRLLKRGSLVEVGWPVIGTTLTMYGAVQLVSGLANALLVCAILPGTEASDMLFLMGAFGFSAVIGMLTPLVPSGLGTRDASLAVLLLLVMSPPEAALVVLVSRVWNLALDVVFWVVTLLAKRTVHAPADSVGAGAP